MPCLLRSLAVSAHKSTCRGNDIRRRRCVWGCLKVGHNLWGNDIIKRQAFTHVGALKGSRILYCRRQETDKKDGAATEGQLAGTGFINIHHLLVRDLRNKSHFLPLCVFFYMSCGKHYTQFKTENQVFFISGGSANGCRQSCLCTQLNQCTTIDRNEACDAGSVPSSLELTNQPAKMSWTRVSSWRMTTSNKLL